MVTVRRNFSYFVFILYVSISYVMCQNSSFIYLNDLPLSALLKVKKSFSEMFVKDSCSKEDWCDDVQSTSDFIAQPLQQIDIIDGNYTITAAPLIGLHHIQKVHKSGEGWQDMKQSKVQKIFQLSVTALAFLAFGGYLLCMIVQAIKSKGTTYYHPALMPMNAAPQISGIKKKRPSFGRRRRRRRSTFGSDESHMATPSPNDLYQGLVMAAEQFVKMSNN
ncbi:hypothetical protein DMENIID0001_154200 [Sergentomyia squamirostris]